MFIVFLLALASTITAPPPPPPAHSIVGGIPVASIANYAFLAQITVNGKHWCAGSFVSRTHLVTAAYPLFVTQYSHCSQGPIENRRVHAGRFNLSVPASQESSPALRVESMVIHPDYDWPFGKHQAPRNDIAVWTVDTDGIEVSTIDLSVDDAGVTSARTLGWGATHQGGASSSVCNTIVTNSDSPAG